MIAHAVYAPAQDNASSLMRPLQEIGSLWKQKPQPGKSMVIGAKKYADLEKSFSKAMIGFESLQGTVLYYDQQELEEELKSLKELADYAAYAKNLGVARLEKLKKQHSASIPGFMQGHKLFLAFHKELRKTYKLVELLCKEHNPDEDSSEFAEFLVGLESQLSAV